MAKALKQRIKKKLVRGVGVNDADYQVASDVNGERVSCPYYSAWSRMLARAYSCSYHKLKPTYKNVSVCDEWLTFSNFKNWMVTQDWRGKQLDKDIVNPGNKMYSPDNCVFVSSQVNGALLASNASRGELPQGVTAKGRQYRARVSLAGVVSELGVYETIKEALHIYCVAKSKYLLKIADEQTNAKIKKGLKRHAQIYLDTYNNYITT